MVDHNPMTWSMPTQMWTASGQHEKPQPLFLPERSEALCENPRERCPRCHPDVYAQEGATHKKEENDG